MHVDVLKAFTIQGLVEPDIARLSVAFLPVTIPPEGWSVDGPHLDVRA